MMTKKQLESGSLVITIYELKYSISGQMRPSVTRSHEMLFKRFKIEYLRKKWKMKK